MSAELKKKEKDFWTLEKVISSAQNARNLGHGIAWWHANGEGACAWAIRHGYYTEITKIIFKTKKRHTKASAFKSAKIAADAGLRISDWRRKDAVAYNWVINKGYLPEVRQSIFKLSPVYRSK
jgi:hypothetical protein